MLKNARIEEEGRCHRRRGLGRAGCPYTGLDAVDWLRGYEDEKLQEFRAKRLHKTVIKPLYQARDDKILAPLQAASPYATIPPDAYNRLHLQAKQLALAVMELNVATPKGLRVKQLARNIIDASTSRDDEASWAAVAARLQPHLKR